MTKKILDKINSLPSYSYDDSAQIINNKSTGSNVHLLQELTEIVNFLSQEHIQFFIDSDFNVHPNVIKVDSASAFFVSLDKNGNITSINDVALKLSGYKEEELLHKSFFEIFIDDEDKEELHHIFLDILSGKHNYWRHSNKILLKDGSNLTFQWSNLLIKDKNQDLSQVHAFGVVLT